MPIHAVPKAAKIHWVNTVLENVAIVIKSRVNKIKRIKSE
jgi:hypothetical protein